MKLRAALTLAGACLLGSSLIAPTTASADPTSAIFARFDKSDRKKKKKKASKKKGKGKKDEAVDGPATLKKKVRLSPKGLSWGMSVKEISALYAKVFDKRYVKLYRRVQPGPRMQALDAELADKKALIKRNVLKFGSTPTGVDYSALKGEYTYRNKESMTHIRLRSGTKRHFFFFENRLWKVYDEHKLRKKSKLGKTYKTAVKRLTKKFKVAPRLREADPAEGLNFTTADWQDDNIIIRALDRGPGLIAIVYVDRSVAENIDRYRTAKQEDPNAIDRDVLDVTDKSKGQGAKDDKKKKGKKK